MRLPSFVLGAVLMAFATAPLGAATDPLLWQKPDRYPVFHERLKPAEFEPRFKKAVEGLEDHGICLKEPRRPARGLKLTKVAPGGPADRMGMTPGDIVTEVDGVRMWKPHHFPSDRAGPVSMTFYSTATKAIRTVEIPPGKIGVFFETHYQLEWLYLRGKQRSDKWDNLVLVARAIEAKDPKLAETCWHRAFKAGYQPDFVSTNAGIALARIFGDNERSAAFGYFGFQDDRESGEAPHPARLYRVAIANYKLQHARKALKEHPMGSIELEALDRLIAMHKARPLAERTLPPPTERAKTMYREDLATRLNPKSAHARGGDFNRLRTGEASTFSVSTGHYAWLTFGPDEPLRDAEFVVRVAPQAFDQKESDFYKTVEVAFTGQSPRKGDESWVLKLGVRDNAIDPAHSNDATGIALFEEWVKMDGRTHEVRLIRVGGRGEAYVNGTRILYVPIDKRVKDLTFMIKYVGVKGTLHSVRATELIRRAK